MKKTGFTLVETILTIAVLAIVVTIAIPSIGQLLGRHQENQERILQLRIFDALQTFGDLYNQYPADSGTNPMCTIGNEWYNCLAEYTDLSANQIRFDMWDQERSYLNTSTNKNLLGTTLNVQYASIHSKGIDRVASSATGIPVSGNEYAAASSGNWWANGSNANILSQFETLTPAGDDILTKSSDQILKLQKYRTTQNRLEDIKRAIVALESTVYTEEILVRPNTADRLIHHPPSVQTVQVNGDGLYSDTIRTDVDPYGFAGGRIENRDNGTQKRTRRIHMESFMRLLGLPDSHCCSALQKDVGASTTNDYSQDRPFFYYSNPRIFAGGTCAPRAQIAPFTPARITQNPYICG